MVAWWWIPLSWLIAVGALTTLATLWVIGVRVYSAIKAKRAHKDHVHVNPSKLTLYTGPGEDPRDG